MRALLEDRLHGEKVLEGLAALVIVDQRDVFHGRLRAHRLHQPFAQLHRRVGQGDARIGLEAHIPVALDPRFALTGEVLRSPATRPLAVFPATLDVTRNVIEIVT